MNNTVLIYLSFRFIQIKFPFSILKKRYLFIFIILYLLYVTTVLVVIMFDDTTMYFSQLQTTNNIMFFNHDFSEGSTMALFTWPSLAAQIMSLVVSVFTVHHLYKGAKTPLSERSRSNGRRSSVKILIQNLGGVVLSVTMIYYYSHTLGGSVTEEAHNLSNIYFTFMFNVVIPCVLSCFNPAVFIVFTPRLVKRWRLWGGGRCVRVNNLVMGNVRCA